MGIYIKGMDMPKTCEECCLESFCNLWIEAIKMSGVELKVGAKATMRHPDCPLVPVLEHGRLIDALWVRDQIIKQWMDYSDDSYMYKRGMEDAYEVIRNAPTIIPADKEGEG